MEHECDTHRPLKIWSANRPEAIEEEKQVVDETFGDCEKAVKMPYEPKIMWKGQGVLHYIMASINGQHPLFTA